MPGSSASLSESIKEEAEIWLQTSLEEITNRLGLNWRDGGDAPAGNVSRDMLEFVGFAQQAVYRGMERELAAVKKRSGHVQEDVYVSFGVHPGFVFLAYSCTYRVEAFHVLNHIHLYTTKN